MDYQKPVSRANPGLVVFVLDDSASMGDPLPGTSDPKYVWVERYTKVLLSELLARSQEKGAGDTIRIKPRYFVYFVIYGGKPVTSWNAQDPHQLDIQSVLTKYAASNYSLGLGGNLSGTDARAAFAEVRQFLARVISQFQQCFPPMVFHLTDGESATDAEDVAGELSRLTTTDGAPLIVNAFLGASTELDYAGPDDFPGYLSEADAGPSEYGQRLFRMSSVVPSTIRANLVSDGIFPAIRPGARLFFDVRTKDMLKHTIQVVGSQGSRAGYMLRASSEV
jgi:hypothetical protein